MAVTTAPIAGSVSVPVAVDCLEPRFLANLRALARRDGPLAQQLGAHVPMEGARGWGYAIEAARDGDPVMRATCAERSHYCHSRYAPRTEAAELIAGAQVAERRNVVCFGFGLGYHIEAALEVLPESGQLVVLEPDLAALRLALETRDLSAVLGDQRVHLVVGATVGEAFQEWMGRFSMLAAGGVAMVALPNIEHRLAPGYIEAFSEQLRGHLHTVAGNLQTLMVMAHVYLSNTFRAVPHLLASPGVNTLFGRFAEVPVICVAAGPSLAAQLPLLAQVQERCLIIACDTATRPLLNAGIQPHLICAGDPQAANHRHIAGLAGTLRGYLCAEPMTYPASLSEFHQRLFLASFRDRLMAWMEGQVGEVGQVLCWGSVATMVFDLARRVGGNPIVFLGQDLSFPGGRTYTPGTYFETELGHEMTVAAQTQRAGGPPLIDCIDLFGRPVQTNRQMYAYHRWFVREIAQTPPGVRVINATGGGILKEGVEVLDFAQVVESTVGEPLDCWERLADAHTAPRERNRAQLEAGLAELEAGFSAMEAEARAAFRATTAWYRQVHHFRELPEQLAKERLDEAEAARRKVLSHGFATILMEMANQTGIKTFLTAHRKLDGQRASQALYLEALEAYLKLFASVIQSVQRIAPAARAAHAAAKE